MTLFAALDIAGGTVLAQRKPKHRHQEFLAFLRHIEANVPEHLDVHLICDNYGTHKHTRVKAWLARRRRLLVEAGTFAFSTEPITPTAPGLRGVTVRRRRAGQGSPGRALEPSPSYVRRVDSRPARVRSAMGGR
jgi:hypothetical protein